MAVVGVDEVEGSLPSSGCLLGSCWPSVVERGVSVILGVHNNSQQVLTSWGQMLWWQAQITLFSLCLPWEVDILVPLV